MTNNLGLPNLEGCIGGSEGLVYLLRILVLPRLNNLVKTEGLIGLKL